MRVGVSASAWWWGLVCVCGGGGYEVWAVRARRHWSALDWSLWSSFFFFPSPPLLSLSVFLSLSPSASDVRRATRFRTGWTTLSRRAGLCCHDDEASLQPVTAGCNNTPWILAGLAVLIKMTLHVSSSPLLAPHARVHSHMAAIVAQRGAHPQNINHGYENICQEEIESYLSKLMSN